MGAFAASKNSVYGNVPTVTETGTVTLGSIRISQDSITDNFGTGVFTIDLPSGVEWNATTATAAIAGSSATVGQMDVTATRATSRSMTIGLATTATSGFTDYINIPVNANVTSVGTGDIVATITDVTTGITSGTAVIGRFAAGSADIKALSTSTVGGSGNVGRIRITENSAGALSSGSTITLKLPTDMTWTAAPAASVVVGDGGLTADAAGIGTRTMTYTVASSSTITVFDIVPAVTIDSDANLGDIILSIGGTANVNTDSIKIGTYAEFDATVTAATPKELTAGTAAQKVATITLKEGIKGSILQNRDIVLELPSGVKFVNTTTGNLVRVSGDNLTMGMTINTALDKLTLTPTTPSTTTAAKYEIRDIEVNVAANVQGPIEMTITGNGGISGTVQVAVVEAPITVEATTQNIKLGVQAQPIGDIYITETAKEKIKAANKLLVLELPTDATWSGTPKVEVVEGNLEVSSTIVTATNQLTLTIKGESTVASKIKLSNLKISTNRSIPEGDVNVTIDNTSTALVDAAANMTNKNTVAKFKVATVTTPAQDGVVQPVVMTVGSTVYTIDGVEMTMDVAPYIKDSRTYFPVRYVAQAVGITADNVVWDGAQRTVTIFRANRIVQVTIGSTTMLVNGVPLTMDVAPEITAERTMLPIRFVAQGLGVNVEWDAATQTVTLN